MVIKTLVENTVISDEYECEHGLSLYIETEKHKLLFDVGASGRFFANAQKMNVNIAEIDTVVISHGHDDHGGGLGVFLNQNEKAKIYIHKKAFDKYYVRRPDGSTPYIGLDPELLSTGRFILTGDYLRIDDELELLSGIDGKELPSSANNTLLMEEDGEKIQDDFSHEQVLIVTEHGHTLMVGGCAHNGIVNIAEKAAALKNRPVDTVISGFHLFNPQTKKGEDDELILKIAERLRQTGSKYWTCHCTGQEPYARLKEILGDQIDYLSTGDIMKI